MPVRHNTGGEFPPGSGKKWLGVQFNNNDVLVNVYGGKYMNKNGKKKTRRFYGGRFKTMRPAMESVIRTLQKKIKSGEYSAYEERWGLEEKLQRAKMQIKKYSLEVTEHQEEEGLRKLNVTSRKRKPRLQSTNPKKIKPEESFNAIPGKLNSGSYVTGEAIYVTPASMWVSNDIDEDVTFPRLPPKSPDNRDYWAGAEDGGASDASMSRECSPFYGPQQELVCDESGLGTLLPPKIVLSEELYPATPPLYEDPFDSPVESESSDVDMDSYVIDDFHKSLLARRQSCLNCRIHGITCLPCEQKDTFFEFNKDMGDTYSPPVQLFGANGFMEIGNFPTVDFLKNDEEYRDEEMMDVQLKMEPLSWISSSFSGY